MRRISRAAFAALAAIGATVAAPNAKSAAPVAAAPIKPALTASDVVNVGNSGFSFGITIRSGHPYYRGYRGYRTFRHGYVLHNGFYFPHHVVRPRIVHRPVVRKPSVIRLSSAHIQWCYARYKTYRHHDNTYAYKVGHRTHCRSPYSH